MGKGEVRIADLAVSSRPRSQGAVAGRDTLSRLSMSPYRNEWASPLCPWMGAPELPREKAT